MWLKPEFAKALLLTGLLLSALAYGGDGISTLLVDDAGSTPPAGISVSIHTTRSGNGNPLECRITAV